MLLLHLKTSQAQCGTTASLEPALRDGLHKAVGAAHISADGGEN